MLYHFSRSPNYYSKFKIFSIYKHKIKCIYFLCGYLKMATKIFIKYTYQVLLVFHLPLFLVITNSILLFIYLLIFHCFDVGHLYATLLRTVFNKKEIKENINTFIIPISIAVISFFWLYLKIPYYWYFYILLTVFHNLRQGWGLIRWYEKKNKTYI